MSFPTLVMVFCWAGWVWGGVVSAHPLQTAGKSGFADFQGMNATPTDPKTLSQDLDVSITAAPVPSLAENLPLFRRQATDLLTITEDLGLQISPKGASMKVFRSGW